MARPTLYTADIAGTILERLCEGRTLREICRSDESLPAESTVRLWALDDRDGFKERYSDAREIGYHSMADEMLDIADDGTNDWVERKRDKGEGSETVFDHEHLGRSRLRFDARRWLLSKALPKIYGDKITQELTGADGAPLTAVINVTRGPKPPSPSEAG